MRNKIQDSIVNLTSTAEADAEAISADIDNPLHAQGSQVELSDPGNDETGAGMVEMVDYYLENDLTEDQGSANAIVDNDVEERTDPSTGHTYYYSHTTGETSWRRSEIAATSGLAAAAEPSELAGGAAYPDVPGEVFIHIPNNNPDAKVNLAGSPQTEVL